MVRTNRKPVRTSVNRVPLVPDNSDLIIGHRFETGLDQGYSRKIPSRIGMHTSVETTGTQKDWYIPQQIGTYTVLWKTP